MRSMLTWGGVLAGSVVLGVGMYGLVVAPATDGLEVLGITAAPDERPTVLKTSARKPDRKPVREQAAQVAPAPAEKSEPESAEYAEQESADEYESASYSTQGDEWEAPENDGGGESEGWDDHGGDDGDDDGGDDESDGGDDGDSDGEGDDD